MAVWRRDDGRSPTHPHRGGEEGGRGRRVKRGAEEGEEEGGEGDAEDSFLSEYLFRVAA